MVFHYVAIAFNLDKLSDYCYVIKYWTSHTSISCIYY